MKKKSTFYPKSEVEKALQGTPPKKLSERVNELILKGLSKEKEEALAVAYEKYDQQLASQERETAKLPKKRISTTAMLSKRLFEPEDEPEDWF